MNEQILNQPLEGLCGQTCIALLADTTVQAVVSKTKCGKNKMTGHKLFTALDQYHISHAEKMKYTRGKTVVLPKRCLLSEKGHFLLYVDGLFYDNIKGVFSEYDYTKLTAYLDLTV
ncbi:hypothetical protein JZO76_04355 [Enterococcus sp. MJM12]|uniref:Uncharacterized protein n=1 Tax=Candidatus Enterococcus myersii TaxID=2815322 RepID=A0ABS3H5M8_9ENTE|nr:MULTISPECIES: hypothetical protein [Enterococcus]MBO0448762.1 hypothetical protein [Enterococcus sp. MJM12]MDT2739977.1 hypothetical protein [Enterococcus canintestini]